MSSSVINVRDVKNTAEELDNLLIPNEIYDLTISRNSDKIQEYFIDNPKLMLDFVGFNSTLKRSSILSSDRKCGCFYTIPWVTKYASTNNLNKTILLFNQQLKIYQYMIRNWYSETGMSNLRYLSMLALDMINELRRFNYNINNNLNSSSLLSKKYIVNKFNDTREIINYFNKLKTI